MSSLPFGMVTLMCERCMSAVSELTFRGRGWHWPAQEHGTLLVARLRGGGVAGGSHFAEGAARGARGENEGNNRGQQSGHSPADALERKQQPRKTRRSNQRTIGTEFVGDASVTARCSNEALALCGRHGRKVV